jgi:NAD(P)H-quinone oxidoreductase subunit 5
MNPGRRPGPIAQIAEGAGLATMVVALVAAGLLIQHGPATATLLPGLSVRLDVISAVMLGLVSFVGWVVLRYARSYVTARRGRARSWAGCARRWPR